VTEDLRYLRHLKTIEALCASVCARNGCFGDDADDFASMVKLKFVEHDYAIIRKHQGRSKLSTYLTVVVANLFKDFRISQWGKWRPSAQAKRLGEAAILLETLVFRDHCPREAAVKLVLERHKDMTAEGLNKISAQLNRAPSRRYVGESDLADVPSRDGTDDLISKEENAGLVRATRLKLEEALGNLPSEDRLIVKMKFLDGLTVSEIARHLKLEQRPLYRRIDSALAQMKTYLEDGGVRYSDLPAAGWWDEENDSSGPSNLEDRLQYKGAGS